MEPSSGLGSIRALEAMAKEYKNKQDKNEAATIAFMALDVAKDLMYLNGCVKRGKGEDIDSTYPGRNVFEYIKEIEAERDQLRKENEKLLWAKEEQLQALADIINAVANETNALNRARLILAKNRGEVDDE